MQLIHLKTTKNKSNLENYYKKQDQINIGTELAKS